MKKLISIFTLIVVTQTLFAHTYSDQSILSSGTWVKIRVQQNGVYRLRYEDIEKMGLNPSQVRIYGYGGAMLSQDFSRPIIDDLPAVPFYMHKGSDNVFNAGDYILFYAQGNISWKYNGNNFVHTRNPYSDYGYYLLTDNAGEQHLLTEQLTTTMPSGQNVVSNWQYDVNDVDSINLLDVNNGKDGGGRTFYGARIFSTRPQFNHTFTFANIQNEIADIQVHAAATSMSTSQLNVLVDNTSIGMLSMTGIPSSDHYTRATENTISKHFMPSSATNVAVRLQLPSTNSGNTTCYLDYIEVAVPCEMVMNGSWMPIRTKEGYATKTNTTLSYTLQNVPEGTMIWDVTDLTNIQSVATYRNGNTLSFQGNNTQTLHEYVAVTPTANGYLTPTTIGRVQTQNLHGLHDIDYVIIAPEQFAGEATRLAMAHETKDGITWAVVTDQQVYNEFSSCTPDATAYRKLMKMLYDREENQPKWLLLMGDGSFDNRKLLANSGPSLLLTYQAENSLVETQAYATDDYFGFLDNNVYKDDKSCTMRIGVGRLPVSNPEEAQQVVDKIIRYMGNTQYGKWKQQLVFLADDGDNGMHTTTAEAGAERVRLKNPDFIVNKIYLDAYPQEVNATGESYPLAKSKLDNMLRDGVLYLNYSGHGGYNNISNEGMLGLADIKRMNNANLGMWMFATCNFASFDAGKRSAAEEAVLNPNGGAIGVFSSCRTVYADQNTTINRNFCDTLFGHKNVYHYDMTLGEAVRIAKNKCGNSYINKLCYILLGDPALRLNYPTDLQVETTSQLDTVNALTVHDVEGQLVDEDRNVAEWFNGKVQITIYDKMEKITTRDNDEKNPEKQKLLVYNDYPSTIFSGEADVVDGHFQYTFMTPKDIRYNYGAGRIVYYAMDSTEHAEAVGHYEDFTIGGSSNILSIDTIGPEMEIYLNNPAFMDGGMTYETPRFYAELYDPSGINTVGSGIGHDLMLMIDNNPKLSYILNNHFTAERGSYQRGQVNYLIPELEDGMHTLVFRAWDLMNNSSTRSLNFQVAHGIDPTIFSVATYPNPVAETQVIHMTIEYDQPDLVMETQLAIYNMQGQLVYLLTNSNNTDMQLPIQQMGLTSGIYVYRVQIKAENSNFVSRSGKIIVTE